MEQKSKIVWYILGSILLIMAISSFMTFTNLHCLSFYNDYDFYFYCRHFRNGMGMKSIIYFIGSMWCFGIGGSKK